MEEKNENPWLKGRGYLHITPKLNVVEQEKELVSKVRSKKFVAKHAFFPLIHTVIKERRFKKSKIKGGAVKRCHSYRDVDEKMQHNAKNRPLHYATHIDALIFGYYAELLQEKYEAELKKNEELSSCITAYRKLEHSTEDRNKSTIDFAYEVFENIKQKAKSEECLVLTFDIKEFFSSLDHKVLKKAWYNLLGEKTLSPDHYNVFKAATNFSYILLDNLRIDKRANGRRAGFDEKRLAEIRKKGVQAFFENPQEFKEKVNSGEFKVYKKPFRRKSDNCPVGIPQGLPISAVLANLYLLEFDKEIFRKVVEENNGFYRRYSDDIIIICRLNQGTELEKFIKEAIEQYNVKISKDKTEKFWFKNESMGSGGELLVSVKITEEGNQVGVPLKYLGFEFFGYQTLIKSANLAKFYRRMIQSLKRKGSRIEKVIEKNYPVVPALYKRKLYKLYSYHGRHKKVGLLERSVLRKNFLGEYKWIKSEKKQSKVFRGNYLKYVYRASEVMGEQAIRSQVRNHWKLLQEAIEKHINPKIRGDKKLDH